MKIPASRIEQILVRRAHVRGRFRRLVSFQFALKIFITVRTELGPNGSLLKRELESDDSFFPQCLQSLLIDAQFSRQHAGAVLAEHGRGAVFDRRG